MAFPSRVGSAAKSSESSMIWNAIPMPLAVRREGLDRLAGEPPGEGADPATRRHERRRLLADDAEVVGLRQVARPLPLELENLGLGHRHHRRGEGVHHPEVAVPHQERHAARVEVVADQDRGVDAPPGVGRGPAAPERRLVDHVVVDQGRGVQELDDAAEPHRTVPRVGPERGAEEHEDGPEPLATGEGDMPGKIADERNGRPCSSWSIAASQAPSSVPTRRSRRSRRTPSRGSVTENLWTDELRPHPPRGQPITASTNQPGRLAAEKCRDRRPVRPGACGPATPGRRSPGRVEGQSAAHGGTRGPPRASPPSTTATSAGAVGRDLAPGDRVDERPRHQKALAPRAAEQPCGRRQRHRPLERHPHDRDPIGAFHQGPGAEPLLAKRSGAILDENGLDELRDRVPVPADLEHQDAVRVHAGGDDVHDRPGGSLPGGSTLPSTKSPRPPRGAASAAERTRNGFTTSAERWMRPRCHANTTDGVTPLSSAAAKLGGSRRSCRGDPDTCWVLITHCDRKARRTVTGS